MGQNGDIYEPSHQADVLVGVRNLALDCPHTFSSTQRTLLNF